MRTKLLLAVLLALLAAPCYAQGHSVTFNWTASPTTGVTGYNVYRFVGACSPTVAFTKLTSTAATVLTVTDTAVTSGSTYCYTVTAFTATAESSQSGTEQIVIPVFTASTVPQPPSIQSISAQ